MRVCSTEGCGKSIHPTTNKSGLCKRCAAAADYQRNREKVLAREAARYAAAPEKKRTAAHDWRLANIERARARDAAYYKENREQVLARVSLYGSVYRVTHREQTLARTAAWTKANPTKAAAKTARYRTARTGGGGAYTEEEWQLLLDDYEHICPCCGRDDVPLQADHIVPVKRGGSSFISNIQPLCGPCNKRKGARLVPAFPPARSRP